MATNNKQEYPRIGTAAFILNNNHQVLMMKRQGSHGAGTWAPPGGKLEMMESFFDCVKREVKEEAGLDILSMDIIGVTNDIGEETHYVTIHVLCKTSSIDAKIMEPEKCSEIDWFNLNNLPEPLFWTVKNLIALDPLCLCGGGKKLSECHGKKS